MFKLIFYYNHYTTLGHSTRVFSLVKGFKEYFKKKIEIVVFQGGKKQEIFPFNKYAKVYKLPYSLGTRGLEVGRNREKKKEEALTLNSMLRERMAIIRKVLDRFRPDIFITEYFPFGEEFWSFETPYILKYLCENTKCRIIGSCAYVNLIKNTYKYIKDFYDVLLIHSPKEFSKDYNLYLHKKGIEEINRVFDDFCKKMYFTGFVLDNYNVSNLSSKKMRYFDLKRRKLILVSRGGGIVNKKIILVSIMLAKERKDLFFVICCGPATSSKELKEYRKLSKGIYNLRIFKSLTLPEFNSFLKAADLSINMAGYNTVTRLLYYEKRTILIPYHTSEQRYRADLVKKYLPSRIIQEKELNISLLGRSVRELIDENIEFAKIDKKNWFSGIYDTIKIIKCLK